MPSGPRIRTDNVFGTLSQAIDNDDTTINSAGLANLAAVSSAHAVIVVDPLRSAGAPEVVVVTAHTSSATSATVTRGAYGTSARSHASGVLWIHAPTVDDVIRICTSSTRPSDPYGGQLIFETDTDKFVARNAASGAWVDAVPLGAWQSWTPTWTNFTVGSATVVAMFSRIGRTIHWRLAVTLSSSTVSGDVSFTLPVALASYAATAPIGVVNLQDANGADYAGQVVVSSGNGRLIYVNSSANLAALSSSAPFTWANGDQFLASGTYEAAA